MLEVTVGDASGRIFTGDQVSLDVRREGTSPEVVLEFVVEVDPTHAHLGGIGGSGERWFLGDDLREVGSPVAKTCREGGKGVDVVPEGTGDSDSVILGLGERQLQGAEESGGARDGHRDESQLPEVRPPLLVADTGRGGQVGEDLGQGDFPMWRELDGLTDRVNHPTEQELSGLPSTVAFQELLERDSLMSLGLGDVRRG